MVGVGRRAGFARRVLDYIGLGGLTLPERALDARMNVSLTD